MCVVWCNKVPTIFTTSNIHQTDMWTPVITVKKDTWWSQILRRSILGFHLAKSGNFNESIAFYFAQMGTFNYKSIVFCWAQTETLTNQLHFILDKRNLNEFSFSKYFLNTDKLFQYLILLEKQIKFLWRRFCEVWNAFHLCRIFWIFNLFCCV